nr:uncharacterized protein LOC122271127 [Parasteatoda tepidariorum]
MKDIRWGKMMEKKALHALKTYTEEHENVIILQSTGLLVDKKHPFLGASIDGKMMCDCHPPAIIEIKCPYSIRNEMTQDAKSKSFFLDKEGCLKLKLPYYNQVQGQMAIWDVELCYFIKYTTIDLNIQKLCYNEAYWQMPMPTLLQFYKNFVISEILDASL